MTVINSVKNLEAKTLTITSEFNVSRERVWQLWSDPRQLEQWWGPPTYPASFVDHNLEQDGNATYFMTGPEGDKHHGWWSIRKVDPPRYLEFEDGFADDTGKRSSSAPTSVARVTLEERAGGGTRMVIESIFPTTQAMQELTEMGMEEGIKQALGQIDSLLG